MSALLGAEEQFGDRKTILGLWAGILIAPLAWFLVLCANFALVPPACSFGWGWVSHLVNLAGMLFCLAAGGLALRNWQRLGRESEDTNDNTGRSLFLARLGLLISALFLLVLAGQEIANISLGPCN